MTALVGVVGGVDDCKVITPLSVNSPSDTEYVRESTLTRLIGVYLNWEVSGV